MTKARSTLLLLLLLSTQALIGQDVTLQYKQVPLNEVLLDLNQKYQVQVSINAQVSSGCFITVNASYKTVDKALERLAKECDLTLSVINTVYSFRNIRPTDNSTKAKATDAHLKPSSFLFQGQIIEKTTAEPLPFSSIQINNKSYTTDENGFFSFKTNNKTEFLSFKSLGYLQTDTLLTHGNQRVIALAPSTLQLKEVIIEAQNASSVIDLGHSNGHIKFNNIQNQVVPGLSNNMVFNNLRLYPGIMASGESIADYVIWGSNAGDTHVLFDGITLFHSWGVNDDIGRINPFLLKNVEVYKGGYNVLYGDRVGGVIRVDGKNGNLDKIQSDFSITNQMANAYISVPLFQKTAALQLALRKTYFEPLNWSAEIQGEQNYITPQYDYQDFNLKFTKKFNNKDQISISHIQSKDNYDGSLKVRDKRGLIEDIAIQSKQLGSAIQYTKFWKKGGNSTFSFAHSSYKPDLITNYYIERNNGNTTDTLKSEAWTNPIKEFKIGISQVLPVQNKHQMHLQAYFIHNDTQLQFQSDSNTIANRSDLLQRLSLMAHDNIQLSPDVQLGLGIKAEVPLADLQLQLQPRVNLGVQMNKYWRFTLASGIYNQFISRNSIIDRLGNKTDFWETTAGNNKSALFSQHHVAGFSHTKKGFTVSVEGYFKKTTGNIRYLLDPNRPNLSLEGTTRSYGMDWFVRQQWKSHQLFLSYSLAKVEEIYANALVEGKYRRAPQDQRHELKGAAIFNFNAFQFSLTQVFGSGFPNTVLENKPNPISQYWRTDFIMQYSFGNEKTQFETGLSFLNLFNVRNERLNQSVNVPDGDTINTIGIPFTPTLYFNLHF